MFSFFLKGYRSGILSFAGVKVDVDFDINGKDGKESFKQFENGLFKVKNPISKHPNILKGVIIAKKSWGIQVSQWSDGINEWCFSKDEVLQQFKEKEIQIPPQLEKEFDNIIEKKRKDRLEKEYERLKKEGWFDF